jgi:hypothetical protein
MQKENAKQIVPQPAGVPEAFILVPKKPTADNVSVDQSLVYIEAQASGGRPLLAVHGIAFLHSVDPTAEPEPDQPLDWVGGDLYGGWVSYTENELFRVRFRAEFEGNEPEDPTIILHATIGHPDGFDD